MADQIGAAGRAVLRELLPAGADVDGRDADGRSALWHAALRGKLEVVVHLVEQLGASPTLADGAGRTPLYAAAGFDGGGGHLEVVRWLAGHGGSVTQPNGNGFTTVCIAACYGHLAVVQWLAGHGGSVTQANENGYTPLAIAALGGRLAVVQWLAGHGGSVTQADKHRRTPLAIAAQEGHLAVVQWLAGHGGSVTQPSNRGTTPAAAATTHGHPAVAAFLTAASSWPAFKILVACRLVDDAKRGLRAGRLDPCAGPTSLAELVAASASPKDALWPGSPDVCPATTRLVHDAMAPWSSTRHCLFHVGVRSDRFEITNHSGMTHRYTPYENRRRRAFLTLAPMPDSSLSFSTCARVAFFCLVGIFSSVFTSTFCKSFLV